MDMLEQIIQLVIILFLLSMVTERIADFLKHYLCGSEVFRIGDTITKHIGDDVKEQARSYRILKINVWCGILTAAILKADLIHIFNNIQDPGKTLGWKNIYDYYDGESHWYDSADFWFLIPGILLTGCFISFGSKFWHDLLDLLYVIKNTKRVLADPETYKADKVETIVQRFNTYQSDFIRGAYHEAQSELMLNDNVKAVALKWGADGLYYIEMKVRQPDNTMSPYYSYVLSDGTVQSIPVKVIVSTSEIMAHGIDLSSEIYEMNSPFKRGTLGCLVRPIDNKVSDRYILTCCHNVVHPVTNAPFIQPGQKPVGTSETDTNPIGTIFSAERNDEMDVALITIDPEKFEEIFNSIPEINEPLGVRTLVEDEKNVKAFLYGAQSGYQSGIITSTKASAVIKYSTDTFKIVKLLTIQNSGSAISKKGDSGCIVVDEHNAVIGIVVGGDHSDTYVIPIQKMLTKLKVKLV